jgi:hypothetical protein
MPPIDEDSSNSAHKREPLIRECSNFVVANEKSGSDVVVEVEVMLHSSLCAEERGVSMLFPSLFSCQIVKVNMTEAICSAILRVMCYYLHIISRNRLCQVAALNEH